MWIFWSFSNCLSFLQIGDSIASFLEYILLIIRND